MMVSKETKKRPLLNQPNDDLLKKKLPSCNYIMKPPDDYRKQKITVQFIFSKMIHGHSIFQQLFLTGKKVGI